MTWPDSSNGPWLLVGTAPGAQPPNAVGFVKEALATHPNTTDPSEAVILSEAAFCLPTSFAQENVNSAEAVTSKPIVPDAEPETQPPRKSSCSDLAVPFSCRLDAEKDPDVDCGRMTALAGSTLTNGR